MLEGERERKCSRCYKKYPWKDFANREASVYGKSSTCNHCIKKSEKLRNCEEGDFVTYISPVHREGLPGKAKEEFEFLRMSDYVDPKKSYQHIDHPAYCYVRLKGGEGESLVYIGYLKKVE